MSESLEICCESCPDYGPLSIKISSDSDKLFPSYCRWKFELISQEIVNKVNKNCPFFETMFSLFVKKASTKCNSMGLDDFAKSGHDQK